MAGTVKIELIPPEIERQLLKGAATVALVGAIAAKIAAAAGASGGEFGHDVQVGKTRARAMVWTEDFAAMELEAKNRVLTKAIDAGRT
jgi:hypothetical protein